MLINYYDAGFSNLKNTVIVTDPCYPEDSWCSKVLKDVQEGRFKCLLCISDEEDWGRRVSNLIAIHEDYLDCIDFKNGFQFDSKLICQIPYYNVIGVDSGQAGIFNYDYYKTHQPDNDWNLDINGNKSWYRRICDITGSESLGGVVDNAGIVSCSGYGDGSYTCSAFYDVKAEKIVGILIDFQVIVKTTKK